LGTDKKPARLTKFKTKARLD